MDFGSATNRIVGRKVRAKAGLISEPTRKRVTNEKIICDPDKVRNLTIYDRIFQIHLYLNVQFYKYPPLENIPLTQFDDFAENRLKLLQDVESCRQRAGKDLKALEGLLDAVLMKQVARHNDRIAGQTRPGASPLGTSLDAEQVAQRRHDHISHFILRLALCKSIEQQRWMEQQELTLFRWRWAKETAHNQRLLLEVNGIEFERVGEDEMVTLAEQLRTSTPYLKGACVAGHTFWKVPMLQALDLVKRRRVLVLAQQAYVHNDDMVEIVAGKFRENLARGLNMANRHYTAVTDEPLIVPVLSRLAAKTYLDDEFTGADTSANAITPTMVERMSEVSFPLCMSSLHMNIKQDHHLKYGGRQQYGLFLKGLGMSLESALAFFRSHFTQIMDVAKFEKQYTYNIRHQYGKEGKRTNYTPMSCAQIQSHTPGTGDNHGCPFKHWGHEQLRDKLKALGVDELRAKGILSEAKSGQLDRACTRFFEATHMLPETALQTTKGLVAHPNKYYEWSQEYRAGKVDASAEMMSTQTTIVPSQQKPTPPELTEQDLEDLL